MNKSILELSIILASSSVIATELSNMSGWVQAGQVTIDDTEELEAFAFSGGVQSTKHNALYTSIGGQIAIFDEDMGRYSYSDTLIGLETKNTPRLSHISNE